MSDVNRGFSPAPSRLVANSVTLGGASGVGGEPVSVGDPRGPLMLLKSTSQTQLTYGEQIILITEAQFGFLSKPLY